MAEHVIEEMSNNVVTSDVVNPITLNSALSMKSGPLRKFSMISEVNNFLYQLSARYHRARIYYQGTKKMNLCAATVKKIQSGKNE